MWIQIRPGLEKKNEKTGGSAPNLGWLRIRNPDRIHVFSTIIKYRGNFCSIVRLNLVSGRSWYPTEYQIQYRPIRKSIVKITLFIFSFVQFGEIFEARYPTKPDIRQLIIQKTIRSFHIICPTHWIMTQLTNGEKNFIISGRIRMWFFLESDTDTGNLNPDPKLCYQGQKYKIISQIKYEPATNHCQGEVIFE